MSELTMDRIKEEVRRLDPDLDEAEDTFDTAVLLLSLIALGPPFTNARVAEFTSQPYGRVATVMRRLRQSGVIQPARGPGREIHADWEDEESGGVAFWLDVCVGEGLLKRERAQATA